MNVADGTVVKGHDAVKAHFERERELSEAYGSSIIFQVYRINLEAVTVEELQGKMVAEIKVDGTFVSGSDTVTGVKSKVRPLLEEEARSQAETGSQSTFHIEPEDQITLFFNGHPMRGDRRFYADHFMLLPAWVQLFLHNCEVEQVVARAAELRNVAQR